MRFNLSDEILRFFQPLIVPCRGHLSIRGGATAASQGLGSNLTLIPILFNFKDLKSLAFHVFEAVYDASVLLGGLPSLKRLRRGFWESLDFNGWGSSADEKHITIDENVNLIAKLKQENLLSMEPTARGVLRRLLV